MMPMTRFGRTGLTVSRIGLGGFPFGAVNRANGWDPYAPEGRATAVATIHAALDAGINYIDTAPGYGDGHSESIIGEALQGRRDRVVLATKTPYLETTAAQVTAGIEASLRRLGTDTIDILQFHGGRYEQKDIDHIRNDGLLESLLRAREQGKVRFIGFTVEEPWSALPLIATGVFDMAQICYNLIYQTAAMHALPQARKADMGVAVMRPMTSGILQRIARVIAPEWQTGHDLYAAALTFVLSDSRVHVANVGMRWPREVARNVEIAAGLAPAFDMADIPRLTVDVYKEEDARL